MAGAHRRVTGGQSRHARHRGPKRRRAAAGAIVTTAIALAAGAALLGAGPIPSRPSVDETLEPDPPTASPPIAIAPPVTFEKLPPEVPAEGSGEFRIAGGTGEPTGSSPLRYTAEVEQDVAVDPRRFASKIEATLADRRGWRTIGDHEFQRVRTDPELRILLATPETVDTLCWPLDTRGELSCRNGELVVINAARWLLGIEAYRRAVVEYRHYVINHEVGHALGYPHETCPGENEVAPVMLQQTIGLDGCLPNPWPAER